MLSYLTRRVLLMVPTLLCVSYLLFMLVALAPGGVGAALRQQGGSGGQEASWVQKAYLDDRYGLNDPVHSQYVRWLRRISPLKFGPRDMVRPSGEVEARPRAIPVPPAWEWFVDALPVEPPPIKPDESVLKSAESRTNAFTRAKEAYAKGRSDFIGARAALNVAIADYLRSLHIEVTTEPGEDLSSSVLGRVTPDRTSEAWRPVKIAGDRIIEIYGEAITARAGLLGMFDVPVFEASGYSIVPRAVSIGRPDLGTVFSRGQTVSSEIARALPVTLGMNLLAIPLIYAIAIPSGIMAANHRGRWIDVLLGMKFIAMWSIPVVLGGILLRGYLASQNNLMLFPSTGLHDRAAEAMTFLPSMDADGWSRGYLLDMLWHLGLPVVCLVYTGFAVLSKQTRAAMLDNFNADYVRTAKAKGVENRTIVYAHVFRNSLLPLITMFANVFPAMLAGSVVVERIFGIPGMGTLVIQAIELRDRELLLGNAMMIAIVSMVGLLIADVLYAIADPRISYK